MDEFNFSQDEIDMINYIKDVRDVVFSDEYDEIEFSSQRHYFKQMNAFTKALFDKSNSFDRRSELAEKAKKASFNLDRKIQSHNARFDDRYLNIILGKKKM